MRLHTLLLLLAAAAGQPALASGTVTGVLTDARDGSAVTGVRVQLGTSALGSFVPAGIEAYSDSQGRYEMTIPSSQTFVLRMGPPEPLLAGYWPDLLCTAGASHCSFPGFGNVSVQAGGSFTADMALTTPGSIGGRLTQSAGGASIANASVYLNNTARSGFATVQVMTDAQGEYLADGLPPGPYRVYTTGLPGHVAEIYDNIPCTDFCGSGTPAETLLPVLSDQLRAGVDFDLAGAGTITGSIHETGAASMLAPVGLRLDRLVDGAWVTQATQTAPAGARAFAFTSLPAGVYALNTQNGNLAYNSEVYDDRDCAGDVCTPEERAAGTLLNLQQGQSIVTNPITLDPAASITACVHDGQSALPGVHVLAYSATPVPIIGHYEFNSAVTGADGCARIDYLAAAPAGLRLRTINGRGYIDRILGGSECLGNQCEVGTGSLVPLAHDQNLGGIQFQLAGGATVAGTVLARANGPAVANVSVQLVGSNGFAIRPQDSRLLLTAGDGRFRTVAVPDGVYTLRAVLGSRTYTWNGGTVTISQGASVNDLVFVLEGETMYASGFEEP